jgi:glycerate-2-kinase
MIRHEGPRGDAEAIWQAAIAAVEPQRLLAATAGDPIGPLPRGRIVVVGAGKGAAAMAAGMEALLSDRRFPSDRLSGLVSVPEGCGRKLARIEVRQTRPAGANLPTPRVVEATAGMLSMLGQLGPDDLAVALITGGGSALLAAPRDGLTLDDKITLARFLPAHGAGIVELNTVRRAASAVKAGGLARACRAGRLVVLVLSDVIGDPLDLIASGPCMPTPPDPPGALAILERFAAGPVVPRLAELLHADIAAEATCPPPGGTGPDWTTPAGCRVVHRIVGNNATAVEAAAAAARALGYAVDVRHARADRSAAEADAGAIGIGLAGEGLALAARAGGDGRPRAIIEGGEATVSMPVEHGAGGRNQQTVIVAAEAILGPAPAGRDAWPGSLVIASIGTDGEDGPTDAAGAVVDRTVAARLALDRAALRLHLDRCDAHPLLDRAGALVRTGATGTNVADVRIVLARP